ncbi:MAG: hypothetical protein JO131_02555 [Gammaproteobacteria bacterium]|nr:hypothetical protein [Gammaproteobacteria bacterium]
MEKFGHELKEENCRITFFNITNVPDYDRGFPVLESIIKQLPLAENYKIISTSLIGYPSKGGGCVAFVSTNEAELSTALEYSYYRNRSPATRYRSLNYSYYS